MYQISSILTYIYIYIYVVYIYIYIHIEVRVFMVFFVCSVCGRKLFGDTYTYIQADYHEYR